MNVDLEKARYVVTFTGGIGITPFLSIIADLHEKKMVMPVTLVWSVRKSEELIDEELFKNYSCANKHFTYLPIIASEQNAQKIDLNLLSGLVNKNKISRIQTYVCGPQLLRTSVINNLRTLGISPHRIHFESFSS